MDFYENMDLQAENLLKKKNLLTIPVPIVKLANELGLEVRRQVLDENESGYILYNVTDEEPKISNIIINENDNAVRQRFTIAHEIGHFILHKQESKIFAHRFVISDDKSKRELQANAFAIGLLTPRTLAMQYIKDVKAQFGFAINLDFLTFLFADHFRISKSSAQYRIKNLLRDEYGGME